tara:strand:+ start:97 stop:1200 length:1104 start_codon:yes stop_codon:yes gene_type:complete
VSKKDNLNKFLNRKEKVKFSLWRRVNYNVHLNTVAQLGTLLVVTFGYFYTIQPVFQHQLLAEKNAQIELDKVRLESEISDIEEDLAHRRRSLDEVSSRNKSLEESVSSYENEIDELLSVRAELEEQVRVAYLNLQEEQEKSNALLNEVEIAIKRETEANERIARIRMEVGSELEALENARWELILTDLSILSVVRRRGAFGYFRTSEDDDVFTYSNYLNDVSENWPNLYLSLMSSIDELEENNRSENKYPSSYIEELRGFARDNRSSLRCERPDFNEMEDDFNRELEDIIRLAEIEARQDMDRIRSENIRPTVFAEGYFESLVRTKVIGEELELDFEFREMVMQKWSDCSNKVFEFYDIIRNEKNIV